MHRDNRSSHLIVPGLRELLDASPDPLFACDADGALLWLSRACGALTGRSVAEQLGKHWSTLAAPREIRRVTGLVLRQRRRRLPPVELALSLLSGDGREIPAVVRVSLLERPEGGVIFVGTARGLGIGPVPAATDAAPVAVPAPRAPAVQAAPEPPDPPAPALLAPAGDAAAEEPRTRGALASAFAFLSRAGRGGATPASGPIPAADEPSAPPDRTSRLAEELEVARATALARAELLCTMAHEFRTPLNGMLGLIHLLSESELDRDQRGMAEVLLHAGESLLGLVSDTLEISGADVGEVELERQPFDVRATTEEIGALLAPLANEKRLHFECAVHEEVPAHVWGDPRRLRQVLLNLGGNAIRYTDRGRVELSAERVSEDERGVTLRFEFQDTGIGMTEEQRARVLRTLQDGEAPVARRDGGAGRGLMVSSRIVARMGGAVGVESSPGRGSTFWFEVALEKRQEEAPASTVATAHPRLAGLRVLVVEPSPSMRRACLDQLTAWGCRAEPAENAEVGLVMLQEAAEAGEPFRLALIERQLPGMDGEEMGAAMRADSGCDRTLTVLVTSAGRRGDAVRARGRGFAAYLTKPLDWGPLAAALAEVLRRAEAAELGATPELVTLHSMAETQRGALRILLVEDSAVNQLVTQWTLKRLGYSLQIAPTAREALEAWKRERFDLVLLDLRLPDGDGYTVAGEMRACEAAGRRAPIVALTASNGPGERARCVAAGMDEYIAKPVDLGQLCRLVRSLTGGSSDVAGETTLVVPARDADDPGKAAVVADDTPLLHAIEAAEAEASGVRPARPAPIPLSSADVVPLAADAAPGESAGTTPLPAIDLARLETASAGLRTVRESLLSCFLEEVRPRLERLGQAVSERDGERVEHEAHGLKGMCATVGATACTDRFAELERLGRERALDLAPALLKQAHLEVTRVERYITSLERPAA